MKPTLRKSTWKVFTDQDIYGKSFMAQGSLVWAWVAYGPRGSEAGVEKTAKAAIEKANAAAYLLSEDQA